MATALLNISRGLSNWLAGGMGKQTLMPSTILTESAPDLMCSAKWKIAQLVNAPSQVSPRRETLLYVYHGVWSSWISWTSRSSYHAESEHGGDRSERLGELSGPSCPRELQLHAVLYDSATHLLQRFDGLHHLQRGQIKECGGAV